jgi:hypothetical protein
MQEGKTITLDLLYDYPDREKLESRIVFQNVAIYSFIHTNGAVISSIEEIPIHELLKHNGASIDKWAQLYGIRNWNNDLSSYEEYLTSENYRAWEIGSAIGFAGFVVAKSISGN